MAKPLSNQIGSTGLELPETLYSTSTEAMHTFAPLEGKTEFDVCIIGGGFTGVSTALHLAAQGKRVAVLEANRLGWGASGRNGGHVGVGQRVSQRYLEKHHGRELAKALWQLSLEAVTHLQHLIIEHGIDCDLKRGILHLAAKSSHVADLQDEAEHLQKSYHYDQMRFVGTDEAHQMIGSSRYHAGVLDEGSLTLNPLALLLGLARAAEARGVTFFEHTKAQSFSHSGSESVEVQTAKGSVHAKQLVIACNGYLDRLEPRLARKIMPINNFILATEPLSEALAAELIRDDVGVQDSLFVVNYWRLSGDRRLVFGGGENYRSRFPKDIKALVRKNMLKVYPQLESTAIDYAWGGTLAITMDRLPDFGQLSDRIYYAQGYSGHGVPTATLAGKLIANAIEGNASEFELMSRLPTAGFPGGTLLRKPALFAGMAFYSGLDRI